GTDLELLEVAAELHRGQLLMVANGSRHILPRHLAAISYRPVAPGPWPKSRGGTQCLSPYRMRGNSRCARLLLDRVGPVIRALARLLLRQLGTVVRALSRRVQFVELRLEPRGKGIDGLGRHKVTNAHHVRDVTRERGGVPKGRVAIPGAIRGSARVATSEPGRPGTPGFGDRPVGHAQRIELDLCELQAGAVDAPPDRVQLLALEAAQCVDQAEYVAAVRPVCPPCRSLGYRQELAGDDGL